MKNWPSLLPLPNVTFSFDVTGRAVIGRGSRTRRRSRTRDGRTTFLFQVNWSFTPDERGTFGHFFNFTLLDGRLPFSIDLASGYGVQPHNVTFLDATFRQVVTHGPNYSISARLLCDSPPVMDNEDVDALLFLDANEIQFLENTNELETFVETEIPTYLENE